ncbi:epoxyqueuosine reductase, partial [Thermoanaerobacter thermohydrosulfuricus]
MEKQKILEQKNKEWGASLVGFSKLTGILPVTLSEIPYAITVVI